MENAELQAHDVVKITDAHPEMDWDDAYAIQNEILRRKLARGNKVVGLKCGLTSHAKMKQIRITSYNVCYTKLLRLLHLGARGQAALQADQLVAARQLAAQDLGLDGVGVVPVHLGMGIGNLDDVVRLQLGAFEQFGETGDGLLIQLHFV